MAKTIEERAVEYKKRTINHANGIVWEKGYREGSQIGYYRGATDQRKINIDKAMKAYCSMRCNYDVRCSCFLNPHLRCQSCENLIKAMED